MVEFLFLVIIIVFIFLVDWRLNKIHVELKKLNAATGNFINAFQRKSTDSMNAANMVVDAISTDDLMKKYGITMIDTKYSYGDYRYDRLEDAVEYAKKHQPS